MIKLATFGLTSAAWIFKILIFIRPMMLPITNTSFNKLVDPTNYFKSCFEISIVEMDAKSNKHGIESLLWLWVVGLFQASLDDVILILDQRQSHIRLFQELEWQYWKVEFSSPSNPTHLNYYKEDCCFSHIWYFAEVIFSYFCQRNPWLFRYNSIC